MRSLGVSKRGAQRACLILCAGALILTGPGTRAADPDPDTAPEVEAAAPAAETDAKPAPAVKRAPGLTGAAGAIDRVVRRLRAAPPTAAKSGETKSSPTPSGDAQVVAAPPPSAPPPSPAPPPAVAPPSATRTLPASARPVAVASAANLVEVPGEKEFNSCRKLPEGKRIVKLNLKPETELQEVVSWIASITCTQFLIPNTTVLSGKKVTIISPQLITANEAYRLFLAALESVGLTVEPTDRFLRIVETNRARFTNLPFLQDDERVPTDKRYVTRLVHLQYLDAQDVTQNVLQRLKGEQGDIIPYQGSTLIITDQAVMINKMMEIISELDVPTGVDEKIWMLRVTNTSVIEMAARLAEIFEIAYVGQGYRRTAAGGAAPAPKPPAPKASASKSKGREGEEGSLHTDMQITKLIPVERTNHLIVVAKPRAYEWLQALVAKLDVPLGDGGLDRVHIYYCEHANCDELAVTLGAVTGVPVSIAAMGRPSRGGGAAQPVAARPAGQPGQGGQTGENQMFEGEVRINYDRPTNALVIVSSLKDYQSMRKVIERLDQPRKQVYIEAVVMEVLLDKSRELGVGYHGGLGLDLGGPSDSLLLGGFRSATTLSPAGLGASGALNGLAGALFGPVLPAETTRVFGSVEIPGIGLFLQALQNNNDVNVLSSPSLIITNNEEGELTVGQNLPFPGAFMGGGFGMPAGGTGPVGAGLFPTVSVQRQDVALKMKLTPSVNEHNTVRLEVDLEISDIVSPNFNNMGPATSKRSVKDTVITRDQQTVLIAGLMSDRTSETVTKVPILGDIPVLGFFFRHKKTVHQKSNIVIALTPHVISEIADNRRVVEKKMRERREFMERFTAFRDDFRFDAELDYSKKRGMVEHINRTVREIEAEERAIREVRERDLRENSSPIELPRNSGQRPQSPRSGLGDGTTSGPVPAAAVDVSASEDLLMPEELARVGGTGWRSGEAAEVTE